MKGRFKMKRCEQKSENTWDLSSLCKDIEDFKGFEDMAMQIVYNNSGTNIDDVINKILANKYWKD